MAAKIENSKHLQNILLFVLNHPLCTGHEIISGTGSIRPPSDISDINKSLARLGYGCKIEDVNCGRTGSGARLTKWILINNDRKNNAKFFLKSMIAQWREDNAA